MKNKQVNTESAIIVGLDIGTTKIAAIIGQLDKNNKLDILGYGHRDSHGVRRGVVNNIEKTSEAIKAAIEDAEEASGYKIDEVHVGIAGQHIRSLQHRGNIMRQSNEDEISRQDVQTLIQNMHKLVMHPGEEIIHVIPQDYIVDNEPDIKNPIGMSGVCLEANFHIVAGQVSAANNIKRCIDRAKINMKTLILEPLASAKAVLSDEEMEAGVALVDIGGGTTDIAIFHDNILRHTAVIPIGGDVVTDDIKEGCSILRNQAEALKIKFGSAFENENKDNEIVSIPVIKGREPKEIKIRALAGIIQARMEEIIEMIYYEIKNSGYEKKLAAGIVLTGGGSMLKHLSQLTEFMTGLETRIGLPTEHLSSNVANELKSPIYSTTIGLVLKGFEQLDYETQSGVIKSKSKEKGSTSIFSKIFQRGKHIFDDETL